MWFSWFQFPYWKIFFFVFEFLFHYFQSPLRKVLFSFRKFFRHTVGTVLAKFCVFVPSSRTASKYNIGTLWKFSPIVYFRFKNGLIAPWYTVTQSLFQFFFRKLVFCSELHWAPACTVLSFYKKFPGYNKRNGWAVSGIFCTHQFY